MKDRGLKVLSNVLFVGVVIIIIGYLSKFMVTKPKTIVEEKMIISSEYRLPYFDFGEGEKKFILLPGSSMTSILDSEDGVKALFSPYTEDYHIYVLDVPEDLDSVTSIDQFADIIADALSALKVDEAEVYGASMGGMIAQKLAIRYPNLVHSLTLASSMSRNNEMSKKVFSKWSETFEPKELARVVNMHVYSEEYYNNYDDVFHTLESNATEKGVKRMHNLCRMMKDFSSYNELDRIKCPVYVFAGSDDNTLGVEASKEIAEKLGCSIKIYDGYSHAVYDEFPDFYDEVFKNLK